MRQKCGIAIAILKNAPAILLDEPTSGLDPQAGFEFIGLLEIAPRGGKSDPHVHPRHLPREGGRRRRRHHEPGEAGHAAARRSGLVKEDLEQVYLQHMAGHNGVAASLTHWSHRESPSMLKLIIEKELRDIIGSTKFAVSFAVCSRS